MKYRRNLTDGRIEYQREILIRHGYLENATNAIISTNFPAGVAKKISLFLNPWGNDTETSFFEYIYVRSTNVGALIPVVAKQGSFYNILSASVNLSNNTITFNFNTAVSFINWVLEEFK